MENSRDHEMSGEKLLAKKGFPKIITGEVKIGTFPPNQIVSLPSGSTSVVSTVNMHSFFLIPFSLCLSKPSRPMKSTPCQEKGTLPFELTYSYMSRHAKFASRHVQGATSRYFWWHNRQIGFSQELNTIWSV